MEGPGDRGGFGIWPYVFVCGVTIKSGSVELRVVYRFQSMHSARFSILYIGYTKVLIVSYVSYRLRTIYMFL